MKKLLLLILSAVMLTMCLTACGDSSSEEIILLNESELREAKEKNLLKTANSNAKQVFVTTRNHAEDFIAEGKQVDKLNYNGPVDKLPDSDPLYKIIKNELKDWSIVSGYIYLEFDPRAEDSSFAQWSESESGTIVGQYPNPPKSYDEATKITLGKKA